MKPVRRPSTLPREGARYWTKAKPAATSPASEKHLAGPTHPSPGEVVGHQQDDGEQPELVDGWQSDSRLGRGQPGDQGGPDEEQQRQLEGRETKGRAAIQEAVQQEPQNRQPEEGLGYRNADQRNDDRQSRQSEDDGVNMAPEPLHGGGNGHSGDRLGSQKIHMQTSPEGDHPGARASRPHPYLRATTTCRSKPQPVTSWPRTRRRRLKPAAPSRSRISVP